MKIRKYILLIATPLLLFSACSGGPLTRLGIEKADAFRTERIGLGFVEGTVEATVYNGNKKKIIFDSGRIDLSINGRTLATVTLQHSTVVEAGRQRLAVPVRIRFAREGMHSLLELIFPKRDSRKSKPEVRVAGSLEIVAGSPLRARKVRFDRKLTGKTLDFIGRQCGNLIEFN